MSTDASVGGDHPSRAHVLLATNWRVAGMKVHVRGVYACTVTPHADEVYPGGRLLKVRRGGRDNTERIVPTKPEGEHLGEHGGRG